MSRTTLRIVTIIWYIVVILCAVPLLGFIIMMLFGFAWSGYNSGSTYDMLYIVAAAVPVALILYVSYWLHKKKQSLIEHDMRSKIESEQKQRTTALSPESSILQALDNVDSLRLQELATRTEIDEAVLVTLLDKMVRVGTIERTSSMDGIYFAKKRGSEN